MTIASDAQVQSYSDNTVRPTSEQIRALVVNLQDAKARLDDIYGNLTQGSPTWTDNRPDNPPHLLTPADVLAWNEFITTVLTAVTGDSNYAIIEKACVRPIGAT